MIKLIRTNSDNPDFVALVRLLDAYLAVQDGEEHSFYDQFNKIAKIKYVVVAYADEKPMGCGAIKEFKAGTMEVKRMYVSPEGRNQGIATSVLAELEKWAAELSYTRCVLETGKRQPEAIALYEKNGYRQIPNYGQYTGVENSVCFEKKLTGKQQIQAN
jgi:putative acetyltransferase